jgi:hypothetical protein
LRGRTERERGGCRLERRGGVAGEPVEWIGTDARGS